MKHLKVVDISEMDYSIWRSVLNLFGEDPVTHVYLFYDLVYELERSRVLFVVDSGRVKGYLLLWRGERYDAYHIWGNIYSLLNTIECNRRTYIHVHSGEELADQVLELLTEKGYSVKRLYYLDMVVDEDSFKPYLGPTVKLNPRRDDHVKALIDIKKEQGVVLSYDEAVKLIRKLRYHGIFIDDALASIAGSYIRTARVWVIGDVYTRLKYRGRGLAKRVTSAVTAEALATGAIALLHVDESNKAAIQVYEKLGYRVIYRKPWIICNPA
jgi:GNAT superfamily N-acetyltransferase